MSVFGLSPPLKCICKEFKMQSDLPRGGNDHLDGIESQEVEASSEVFVCLSVLSFCLAMWNADMKLEKQGLW